MSGSFMMVPSQITVIGFYRFMLKLGLVDSYIPLIVVYFILSKYIVAGVALGGVKG